MYVPRAFEESRPEVLQSLIRSHPFATLVIQAEEGLVANHIPFSLDSTLGRLGTLRGHVSRSNPLWRQLHAVPESLAVFQGPLSYITPSWYPSKQASGEVVPTWNYAVVHAYGRPRAIEDEAWLLEQITQLTTEQESGRALPWKVADAPREFIERMIAGIVGIEIQLSRIQGKWKVSQNRTLADRRGVVAGLEGQDSEHARAMAALVAAYAPGDER